MSISAEAIKAAGISIVNSSELYPNLHQPGDAGLATLVVENALGRAVVALQGAHIMSFQAAGKDEMLWLSPKSLMQAGKPIRGGIPLCLPWFGPSADGQVLHGFARLMPWSVAAAERLKDGETRLVMTLAGDASVSERWPHAFAFSLEIVVGAELKLTLSAENRDRVEAPFAFAYHTYFAVPKVAEVELIGLEGRTYIDKTDNMARKTQAGSVQISALTDRVYLDVGKTQTIITAKGKVRIDSPSRCAVVWNAWTNDRNMADLGEGNHVGYLCVERGDCADYAVTLPPGGTYRATMTLAYA